jgi:O-antigen/teichoic acid export membrane protein
METAFFNFSRKKEEYKEVFSTAMTSIVIVVFLFIVLMLLNKQSVGSFVGYPNNLSYVVWFTALLAIDVMKTVPYALIRYLNKPKKFALFKSTGIVLIVALNIFFVVIYPDMAGGSLSVENIFIANLIASAVEMVLVVGSTLKHISKPNLELWRSMFKYAWPLVILGFAGMINETFDRLAMRKLLPPETVDYEIGVYGTFYKLSMLMTIFIQAFRYAVEPFFFAQSDKDDAKSSYVQIMNWFVYACGGIFLIVSLFKSEIAHLFIRKPEFHEHPDALFIIPILLMANLFLGVFFNLSIWYKLNDKTKLGALVSVISAAVTVVLLIIYIPIYGFKAAGVTTLIAYLLMTVISYFLGQKHYPVAYNVKQVLMLIVLSAGLYIATEYLTLDGLVKYALYIGFIAVYGLLGYRILLSTKNPKFASK